MDAEDVLAISNAVRTAVEYRNGSYLSGSYGALRGTEQPFEFKQRYRLGNEVVTITLTRTGQTS